MAMWHPETTHHTPWCLPDACYPLRIFSSPLGDPEQCPLPDQGGEDKKDLETKIRQTQGQVTAPQVDGHWPCICRRIKVSLGMVEVSQSGSKAESNPSGKPCRHNGIHLLLLFEWKPSYISMCGDGLAYMYRYIYICVVGESM